jgi:hypothetical protein
MTRWLPLATRPQYPVPDALCTLDECGIGP